MRDTPLVSRPKFTFITLLLLSTPALMGGEQSGALNALPHSITTLLNKAIVSVRADGMDSGSGFVVASEGLVVTASTLISQDQRPVQVRFANGLSFSADVVATDQGTESALLRIRVQEPRTFSFLPLGDSSAVKIGSLAVSAGNPLDSIHSDRQVAVSSGTITGTYDVCSADAASRYCGPALETDAAINAGSEGGALLNDAGQVIGMTCLAVNRTRMMGTAVPINRIESAYKKYLAANNPADKKIADAQQNKSQDAFDRATRALVKIYIPAAAETITGVVIDEVGHVLTSGSFVAGQRVDVTLAAGGRAYATVLRQSSSMDLSLLKLDAPQNAAWIPLMEKASIVAGIRIAIVNRCASCEWPSISTGIISAVGRLDGTAVQTDARMNASNAGGAVLNSRGELIGVVSHTKVICEYRAQNAGVSFFTPSSVILSWVEELYTAGSASGGADSSEPLVKLIDTCSKAFVFIGDGSGVVITEDGYVLTNCHVAGSRASWTVRLGTDEKMRVCDVVSKDLALDLCLLKIRGVENTPCIKIGSGEMLESGQRVLALGDPFKLGEKSGGPAASLGVISALHRHQGRNSDAIQTDCAINPGNSGGPLLNLSGELIGLNGQIISRYGKNNTGVAFAIPIDQIKAALPILKNSMRAERDHSLASNVSGITRW